MTRAALFPANDLTQPVLAAAVAIDNNNFLFENIQQKTSHFTNAAASLCKAANVLAGSLHRVAQGIALDSNRLMLPADSNIHNHDANVSLSVFGAFQALQGAQRTFNVVQSRMSAFYGQVEVLQKMQTKLMDPTAQALPNSTLKEKVDFVGAQITDCDKQLNSFLASNQENFKTHVFNLSQIQKIFDFIPEYNSTQQDLTPFLRELQTNPDGTELKQAAPSAL